MNGKKEIEEVFKDLIKNNDHSINVNEMYNLLRSKLVDKGLSKLGKYSSTKAYKSWWDKELSFSYKLVKKAFRAFQNRSDTSRHDAYLKQKQEFYNLYCKKEEEYWNSVIHNIDQTPEKTWKLIQKHSSMPVRPVVQPIVSSDGKVAFQDHEIATEFCKAYGKNSVHVSDYIKSVEVNQLKSSLTSDIGNSSSTLLLNKESQ